MVCQASLVTAAAGRAGEIAVTVDDLPAHGPLPAGTTRLDVARQIIVALKEAGVPAVYGFVNGERETDPDTRGVLALWRRAGYPLGNHTWSHQGLETNTLVSWEADVLANEPRLSALSGSVDWRWLRFPFLQEGKTPVERAAVRAFLVRHGYRIAQVTMDFQDYAFNAPYARCAATQTGTIAALRRAYLSAAARAITRSETMARTVVGRPIPYVLLLHAGAFDARMLPALLALYRSRGFRFVTLPGAERDPFYRADTDLSRADQPDTLEAAMAARQRPLPPGPRLAWLDAACR